MHLKTSFSHRNRNCRRTSRIPTRREDKRPNHESKNTDAHGTRTPTTTPYVKISRRHSTWSPTISSGLLSWTWDILCTWLTCWPNCTGQSSGNTIRMVLC